MLRFNANLSLLFTEVNLEDRFEAAARHGFSAVEIQFPYTMDARQIEACLNQHQLKLVLFNVDADTLLSGGEGLAAVPDKRDQFRKAVDQTLEYASILKPQVINVLPGRCLKPAQLEDYLDTFRENLLYACRAFSSIGIKTVFEAVNTHDMPGFIIHRGQQMLDVINDLKHPDLRMQYDLYHMQMMQEDCTGFLKQHLNKIGHIQFADCPGRHQPGTGNTDFSKVFALIRDSDYRGWTAAEYFPTGSTDKSLDWFSEYTPDKV